MYHRNLPPASQAEDVMAIVRETLAQYDLVMLANRTGLHVSTLYGIRNGRTKWPRPHTLFTILPVIGLRLRLERGG